MRGAFTGADTNKKGLLEVAERGTIFLDEIGETSVSMQVKLLRVLQERRFRRLGGTEESPADIRVVAATNQELSRLVAGGKFREDLYYRINVIPVHLPPLRERREDVSLLADHFLDKHAARAGKAVRSISPEALERLVAYAWPGNVRELENVIERCIALERESVVLAETLPAHVRDGTPPPPVPALPGAPASPAPGALPEIGEGFDLEARGEDFYRHYIALALERAGGVQVKAAEMLGMSFRSFRYYAKKLKLR
jgi:transcriptional regulator with PAS, ATPase and Fis domain